MSFDRIACALLLACALCLSASACGSESTFSDAAPPSTAATSQTAIPAIAGAAGASGVMTAAASQSPDSVPPSASASASAPVTSAAVGSQTPATPSGGDFCGALAVVQGSCQACHGVKLVGGAPMPLVTYDDFMKPALSDPTRKVHQLVAQRIHDQKQPMPPSGLLQPDKLDALDSWLQAGAVNATAACPAQPLTMDQVAQAPWPPADCEDVYKIVAHDPMDASKPYTIAGNSEVHPMITFDAPWGEDDVQLLATRPIEDKLTAVHHWILWDSQQGTNLTFWAPGSTGDVLPPDVGLYMPKGAASLGLDMHYFNKNSAEAVQDQSGVELCVTRKFRPKMAALYGLRGNANVPAMARAENPTSCSANVTQDVTFLGIQPHMHKLGVHAHLDQKRGSDPMQVLYDAPYTFNEQTLKPLSSVVVKNGDVLTTTCTYQNDSARNIAWGDSTEDEMCINWMRYYPKGALQCGAAIGGGRAPTGLPAGGFPTIPQLP